MQRAQVLRDLADLLWQLRKAGSARARRFLTDEAGIENKNGFDDRCELFRRVVWEIL